MKRTIRFILIIVALGLVAATAAADPRPPGYTSTTTPILGTP